MKKKYWTLAALFTTASFNVINAQTKEDRKNSIDIKLILSVIFISILSIEVTTAQSALGKIKTQAKEIIAPENFSRDISITSEYGYDKWRYLHKKAISSWYFNDKNICFLESFMTNDEKTLNEVLYFFSNKPNYNVYQFIPEIPTKHECVIGEINVAVVVKDNLVLGGHFFYLWIFKLDGKDDVQKFFEKKYKKEFSEIKEREYQKERQNQAELKRQKEVTDILSTANRQNIKEQVCKYYENKLLKESEYWDVLAKPQKKEIATSAEVAIHTDSLHTSIIKIDKETINYDLEFLHRKASHYCTINGTNYYKYQNHIFYIEKIYAKTKPLEKGMCGVEKRKGKFKYYQTVPNEIQEWCQSNIIKNGFQAIEYTNYDGQYTIKPVTVTKDVKKILQGKNSQKAKKTWKTLGIICGNVVLIGGIIALQVI